VFTTAAVAPAADSPSGDEYIALIEEEEVDVANKANAPKEAPMLTFFTIDDDFP